MGGRKSTPVILAPTEGLKSSISSVSAIVIGYASPVPAPETAGSVPEPGRDASSPVKDIILLARRSACLHYRSAIKSRGQR
jgi:hypothetical protein